MSTTLENQLQAVLTAVTPRVYADVAPEGTAAPYIVWHLYGGDPLQYTEGQQAAQRNAWVQVNVWSASRTECNTLAHAAAAALLAHPTLQATVMTEPNTDYDKELDLRGSMQDFSLWAER